MTIAGQRERITELLDRSLEVDARILADQLAENRGVRAVLFYGNRLRDGAASGLLDFYVLTESDRAYHGGGLSVAANRLLPPNVYFVEHSTGGVTAKVAVISLASFRHRMRQTSWDTTLWARFCQPAILAYAADDAAREDVLDAVTTAFQTAAWWAARLGPEDGDADEIWTALFAHTYGAELRVESKGRVSEIVATGSAIYTALYQDLIAPTRISEAERVQAKWAWRLRRLLGKPLNILRLCKAAFTFKDGIAYALSKVERHTGRPVELGPIAKRLPWLAAPFVMIRLLLDRRLR